MDSTAKELAPETWLDEHGDALFAYAMGRVHNRAIAEDLVQETLIAAFTGSGDFRGKSSVRTWLTGILKFKTLDYFRQASRELPFDAQVAEEMEEFADRFDATGTWTTPPRRWQEPAGALENEQLGEALAHCVERLPEKLRTLFVLREIDGVETNELIATLNISSANNLWVMMSRSRERLRQCLESKWVNR